jgi:NAD(P)-dependent dehydrogenase (short-subunit alcohol dehydrogenase family)
MDPAPTDTHLPSQNEDGGFTKYLAAGKLKGKKALITGGDSGIGRAIVLLFAMEGAESTIAYLPEEEKDAQDTKQEALKYGGTVHLIPTDLTLKENCKDVVNLALKNMGAINILVNNAAYQMVQKMIGDLSEYVTYSCHSCVLLGYHH